MLVKSKNKTNKIGIFGGTFNPIHFGHLRAAEDVRELLGLEKVLFIPSGNPPLKSRNLAESRFRYEMVKLAISGNARFKVLDIECKQHGKSFTVDTLEMLNKLYAGSDIYFLLGVDAFLDIPNWKEPQKLLGLANFVVLSRPDTRFRDLMESPYVEAKEIILKKLDKRELTVYEAKGKGGNKVLLLNITPVSVSSTDIRERIMEGKSVKYMLPKDVESFIIHKKLYVSGQKR